MIRLRGLQTWLIVSALIAGTLLPGLAVARPGFNLGDWSFVLTYDIDENWDITYTESGDFTHLIDCAGTWSLVTDETMPTTSSKHLHEFAMDYLSGEFGFVHIEDGSKTTRISVCSLFTLDAVSTNAPKWVTGGTACSGATTNDITEIPFTTKAFPNVDRENSVGDSFSAEQDDNGVCYTVKASGPGHRTPYTGIINGGFDEEDTLGPGGVFNHDQKDVATVGDWILVGGQSYNTPETWVAHYPDVKCKSGTCPWSGTAYAGVFMNGFSIAGGVGHVGILVKATD